MPVSVSTGPSESRPASDFAQLFAEAQAKRETLRSVKARFTETTRLTLLERPLVAHGTIIAAPPSRVLMTYTDPERRLVAIDTTALLVVWPDRHERQRLDIAQTQKRIDRYFSHASLDELESMFEIRMALDASVKGAGETDRIEMIPRRKQVREGLERLVLWIDRARLLLLQMELTFPGGDTKTVKLEDIEINVPIAADTFTVRP